MFASMAKIDLRHIPYKGSAMARADLLGGQVKLGCLGVSSVIHSHRAGQLRMLAVTSAQRSAELPDIPSIAETVPGYEATLWSGMLAPAGTPPAVINRIYGEIAKLVQRPDVKTPLSATGTDIVVKGPQEFATLLRVEFDKWGKVVREVKLWINQAAADPGPALFRAGVRACACSPRRAACVPPSGRR